MRLLSGPHEPLLPELREAAERHAGGSLQISVAWVNEGGAKLLREAVESGPDEIAAIVGINSQGTTVEGLLELLAFVKPLRVLYRHPFVTFHPKAYCFDDGGSGTMIVGSGNATPGGLDTNYEMSGVADLTPALREEWAAIWAALKDDEFCLEIDSPAAVEKLYRGGYVPLEATARARRQSLGERGRGDRAEGGEQYDLPTEPLPRRFAATKRSVEVPFPTVPPGPSAAPVPGSRRIYVRTLTANDVAKLQAKQTGTFEPDVGLSARDEDPGFWGWPGRYKRVVRKLARDERSEPVRLYSSLTGPAGVNAELTIWFRAERPGHPAEFRLRPGPISVVRAATPADFDTDSLLIVEENGAGFDLRLLTGKDPGYAAYASMLAVKRPRHRYGYGYR